MSLVLKSAIKTDRRWVRSDRVTETEAVTLRGNTYPRVLDDEGEAIEPRTTYKGRRAGKGMRWVYVARRSALEISLAQQTWDEASGKQMQEHVANVLSVNAEALTDPLYFYVVEAKRQQAHDRVRQYVSDKAQVAAMVDKIDRRLGKFTRKQFEKAWQAYIDQRVDFYRSRGMSNDKAAELAYQDAQAYVAKA